MNKKTVAVMALAAALAGCKGGASDAADARMGMADAPAGAIDAPAAMTDAPVSAIDAMAPVPDAMLDAAPATPAITAPGVPLPVGAARATIGAAGGTLVADFGRVTLVVPAGALAADTLVSITPISNTAPAGLGNAYRLAPDGLVFATPATLTLALDDEDQHTAALAELGAATQTADGGWSVAPVVSDAAAHTSTVSLAHFCDWTWFQHLSLATDRQAMFADQAQTIVILETEPIDQGNGRVLPVPSLYGGPVPATWALLGNGALTPAGHSARYQAAAPPSQQPILITATLTLPGGPQVILFARIHVLARTYRVAMSILDLPNCTPSGTGALRLIGYRLTTSATFDVALDDAYQASLVAASAPVDATVTDLVSCPLHYSSALGPGTTPGITVTGVGGGYRPERRRLAFTIAGTWADMPDYTETFDGPPVKVTHKPALIEDLQYLSPLLAFEGGDGEHHDYDDVTPTIEHDFQVTLTALQY